MAIVSLLLLASSAAAGLGTTEPISVSSDGVQGNSYSHSAAVSADGRFVAFVSDANNLVPGDTNREQDIFVRDRLLGTTERVSVAADGTQANADSSVQPDPGPAISADGRFVTFQSAASNLVPGDTNGREDIFVRDRQLGVTERVSISTEGKPAEYMSYSGEISADGRFVVFPS